MKLGSAVLLAALIGVSAPAQSAAVTTNVFDTTPTLVGTLTTPGITFATDNAFLWHPFGLADFSSSSTGSFLVSADGVYLFTLTSDDGSVLTIDGVTIVDNSGIHAPETASGSAALTAGLHPFEVTFFECCGDPSGVDLLLPTGVTITDVPEPGTLALLGMALAGFGLRRKLVA